MTPKEYSDNLFKEAFARWGNLELSHDKNVAIAQSICLWTCDKVLSDMGADRGYAFWTEVKADIATNGPVKRKWKNKDI